MTPAPDALLLVTVFLVLGYVVLQLLDLFRLIPETFHLLRTFLRWIRPRHWQRLSGLPLRSAVQIEDEFFLRFPAKYRAALTNRYPLPAESPCVVIDEELLRSWNASLRENGALRDAWRRSFWWIGLDGKAGFYFLNTAEEDSRVYHCDDATDAAAISDALSHPEPFEDFLRGLGHEKRRPPGD